jgi:hypothetical protein
VVVVVVVVGALKSGIVEEEVEAKKSNCHFHYIKIKCENIINF